MKKIFGFVKKKKGPSSNASDSGSVLSVGYDLKEKDLGKLHKAAVGGDLAKLKQLIKKNDINQLDKENRTPLHLACAQGHAEVVRLLLDNKAKLNLCDNDYRTPLMKAVQCQQERCAVYLLEVNADPNLVDTDGNTALHLAAMIPDLSLATHLLEHDAHVNASNKEGFTPLILAVAKNHQEMAEFLLKEGANVDSTDSLKRTALMFAANNGQINMVRLLLRYNADISIKEDKGWTAEDYAVMNGHHAASNRAGDSWASSDEDEDFDFSPKKPQRPNLTKLMNSSQKDKKNVFENAVTRNPRPIEQPEPSKLKSKEDSKQKYEDDTDYSLPKAFSFSASPVHPAVPSNAPMSKHPMTNSAPVKEPKKIKTDYSKISGREEPILHLGQTVDVSDSNSQDIVKYSKHEEQRVIKYVIERDAVAEDCGLQKNVFSENISFPNVIGAIDCTHVRIKAPAGPTEPDYINRKSYHSINVQNTKTTEVENDFDDFTQSSDTATEELEMPVSGCKNASLMIKQLDSSSIDHVALVKIQNMFHEYERTIEREKGRYALQSDKVKQLENENKILQRSLEETRDIKSMLEHKKVEWETDQNNLKIVIYDMLCTVVHEPKLLNPKLEDERDEAQRLLSQERSTRSMQEGILNNHLRRQKEIEQENKVTLTKSTEVFSHLSEVSDKEKDLTQQTSRLQEEIAILKLELEKEKTHNQAGETKYLDENEALKEKVEDLKQDLKLNEEALAHTVFQYTGQISTLKTENTLLTTKLEHEKQAKDKLELEVESLHSRLASAIQELERNYSGKANVERALQQEKDEIVRLQEKSNSEMTKLRESINSLSQQLGKAELKANCLENECHRATLSLTEKTLLFESTQREKEQVQSRLKETENLLQIEKEQLSKSLVRQESMQERLAQAQSENMLLRQQLDEAQNKGLIKERVVNDVQDRFNDILTKLRADTEDRVHMIEERNKEVVTKNNELNEKIQRHESEKVERETTLRQLQQELADALKKLSMSEASLEVNIRYRSDLEEEKIRLQKDIERLKGKLQEMEDQYVHSERRSHDLKNALEDKEREVIASSQKLQEMISSSSGTSKTLKQLEEHTQRLEIENARLEAATKQQNTKLDALKTELQESISVRNRLEEVVTNLQGSKISLEEQLNREVQKQNMLSHNAQDSHLLWEEELKSRSKLGIRLTQLEREKSELVGQIETEKKRIKKISEMKRSVETRLDQEMKRNSELQKELNRMRTLAKTAKKKLKEQENGEFASQISSIRGELNFRHHEAESTVGRMKSKIDELSQQLENESLKCRKLESTNRDLQEQFSSMKALHKSHEKLEKNKRQLEEEVLSLRHHLEMNMTDQSQMEHYKREVEERARQDIRQKLEEVNLFLQTQAASQEALEQIKSTNEATLRNQLEQRIKDLESELSRIKNTHQENMNQRDSTQTELERYKELYTEELKLRKSLAAKLDRSNERLAEANTKLLNERQRSKSLIASNFLNGSLSASPTLDMNQLQGSMGNFGGTSSPLNRSLGLGGSFLNPVGEGLSQNSKVEAYIAKMQSELEKSITKELEQATAELNGGSMRMSPVGSAAGSKSSHFEKDPVTRATQQYLEVLKKNYMI
ncbi:ANR26 protein, partial [Polypterus senegalus]